MPAPDATSSSASGHTPVSNNGAYEMDLARQSSVMEPASGDIPMDELPEKERQLLFPAAAPPSGTPELCLARELDPALMALLPDVAVASFGEIARPPNVIGTDERVPITGTTLYPWRAIASLLITTRSGSQYIGTGWFISARTLITAGHCVFIKGGSAAENGWVASIQVMPGRNGPSLPFGAATSTRFQTVGEWANQGDPRFDYGAIFLPVDLGSRVGFFGLGALSDAELRGVDAHIAGYPGDQPMGTMWYDHKRIAEVDGEKVYYPIDTVGGQSGSAVFVVQNNQPVAVAVHAYGGVTNNSGTRINRQVYNNMLSWRT